MRPSGRASYTVRVLEPRTRILWTSLAALGISLVVTLTVIGGQQSSGRSDLTERATTFVRTMKVRQLGRDVRIGVDVLDFLRPEDRSDSAVLAGLRRLEAVYRSIGDDLEISNVEILGGGKARTMSPFAVVGLRKGSRGTVEARQIDWIRGTDGRWYLDPEGL